jgi:hypothetical protein
MDLHQLHALAKYWRIAPPLHELFAAFAGYKAPSEVSTAETSADDSEALLRDLAALGIALPAGIAVGATKDQTDPDETPR